MSPVTQPGVLQIVAETTEENVASMRLLKRQGFTNTGPGVEPGHIRLVRNGRADIAALAESLVKQVSKRVKGAEKFWNDGVSGEAILQLRAAIISDGGRLSKWVQNHPISVFSPRCRPTILANAT